MSKISISLTVVAVLCLGLFYSVVAKAQPVEGMIGKTLPPFLVYVPFNQEETRCIGGDVNLHVMVRNYTFTNKKGKTVDVRSDLFLGNVIIGHWMPGIKKFFPVGKDGKVISVVPLERFYPVQHCQAARGYYESVKDE